MIFFRIVHGQARDTQAVTRGKIGLFGRGKELNHATVSAEIVKRCLDEMLPNHQRPPGYVSDGATWVVRLERRELFRQYGDVVREYARGLLIPVGDGSTILPYTRIRVQGPNGLWSTYILQDEAEGFGLCDEKEAKSRVAEYKKNDEPHGFIYVYGSHFYGQSRDVDFAHIMVYGDNHGDGWTALKTGRGKTGQEDIVYLDARQDLDSVHPMQRLAAECLMLEYPHLEKALVGFPVMQMSLVDALQANEEHRLKVAKVFPCDYTLRKAAFAHAQREIYTATGAFKDNKVPVMEYFKSEAIERLMFHAADCGDLRKIYGILFDGAEYPSGLSVVATERRVTIRDVEGNFFVSDYRSNYGWDELEKMDSPAKIDELGASTMPLDVADEWAALEAQGERRRPSH